MSRAARRGRGLLPTLRGYRPSWLAADALAGLTLVAVVVPSQMATARLADLSVVAGLYAFAAGALLYALLGTDPHLSVGADSTIAPVLAVGVTSVAVVGSSGYGSAMAFTAIVVGAILIAIGLVRLGWISELLSTPVITGILAGIAVGIIARQLPIVFGVAGGGTTTVDQIGDLLRQLDHINFWSLGIALGVLAIILVAQRLSHRLPGALLGLVLSIVAVDALALRAQDGVSVIGSIHGGLPGLALPTVSWSQLQSLIPTVLTVAFLCIAQTAATVRRSGAASEPTAGDFNRDLIAVGAGSVAAGLIGTLAVDASPPNTAIATASGTRSQLANIMAALVVVVAAVGLTAPLADLPEATLAATLVFVATKLFRVDELHTILHFDRLEFALAAVTILVVALVGIEQGVLLAMILSLADRTRRTARPRDTLLGRDPGTDHWIPRDIGRPTEEVPGVLVYMVYAPLWYGNADYFRSRIRQLLRAQAGRVRTVIIDADAMSDIDYTGLQALRGLATELGLSGVALGIARASHIVHHDLKHGSLIEQLGADHLFASVDDAVAGLRRQA